jgi:metal-responsive CopG/Arc/MetJ family transcriptional regulator
MVRVILTVPEKLMERFDKLIKGRYNTRNEAIRAGMKLLIKEMEEERHKSY